MSQAVIEAEAPTQLVEGLAQLLDVGLTPLGRATFATRGRVPQLTGRRG